MKQLQDKVRALILQTSSVTQAWKVGEHKLWLSPTLSNMRGVSGWRKKYQVHFKTMFRDSYQTSQISSSAKLSDTEFEFRPFYWKLMFFQPPHIPPN